tara:strand:+ start:3164 stop:5008 length:1845 start_codon:yes stop_codon:yes gene_type:complete
MCGFAGVFDINGVSDFDHQDILKATKETSYRGPDDSGFYKDQNCIIGFNRLSIVDLKAKSQPLVNEQKDIVLVCNGEIYNYMSLKKILEKKYEFKTNMDTEVLLHGYQEWGDEIWKKASGMFSVVLYDKNQKRIKLIRDHAGIKPLHYLVKNKRIYFSNDLKSFFFIRQLNLKLREKSILSYLSFRYVLGENTFFENIKDVLPGQLIYFDKKELKKIIFWQLNNNSKTIIDEKSAIEELNLKLLNAVNSHLIGDVKIGIFVSGGLDSSLVAHYLNKSQKNIEGFGSSVKENGYDELYYINRLCEDENINLNIVEINKNNFLDNINNIIKFRSEPASIPHETGFFLMSKLMSKKIKVVMSGEGADELFGGYGRLFQSPIDFYKKRIFNLKYAEIDHFLDRYSIFKDHDKSNYLNLETFSNKLHDEDSIEYLHKVFSEVKHKNYFDKMYYVMFKIHLVNMLNRLDRMTMSASIEARVPFLDRDLIEYIYSLPSNLKIKWRSNFSKFKSVFLNSDKISENLDIPKYILKKVAEKKVNNEIIYRKKVAFPIPLNNWMKKEMGAYIRDTILIKNSKIANYINVDNIKNKLDTNNFDSPEDLDGKKFWMLLNLENWLRTF